MSNIWSKSEYQINYDIESKFINSLETVDKYGEVHNLDNLDSELKHKIIDTLVSYKENNEAKGIGLNNPDKINEILNNRSEFEKLYIDEMGNFYFNFYNKIPKDLEKQYLFRFMYLCTFMKHDGMKLTNGKRNLLSKDLIDILKLSQREILNTKKALESYDLIHINESKEIEINKNFCYKGRIGRQNAKGSVRMFENGIKDIYERSKPNEHKKLAMLIDLLPYINFNYNIICDNPTENEMNNIKAYNMSKIMNVLGYTNLARFKKELLSLTVCEEPVICITETINGKIIAVNPKIYYKGNSYEALTWLINIFRVQVIK